MPAGSTVTATLGVAVSMLVLACSCRQSSAERGAEVAGEGATADTATSELPVMQLHVTPEDLDHFRRIHDYLGDGSTDHGPGVERYQRENVWREGSLTWEGRTYPMEIKSHGRTPYRHRDGDAISYSVKVKNRGQIRGAHRFTLLIYKRNSRISDLLRKMAETVGNHTDLQFPVSVRFNDGPPIPYFFEYRLNNTYADMIGQPSLRTLGKRVLGKSAVISHRRPEVSTAALAAELEEKLALYTDDKLSGAYMQEVRRRFREINGAIARQDVQAVAEFFDADYIAGVEAIRLLLGAEGHGFTNNIIYYDTASGLLYPFWHRDFQMFALTARPTLERMDYAGLRYPLWEMLSRNDDIRQAKYRILYDTLTVPDYVAELEALYATTARGPVERSGQPFVINLNARLLRNTLERFVPEGAIYHHGRDLFLTVRPGSVAALSIQSLHGVGLGETHRGAQLSAMQVVANVESTPQVLVPPSDEPRTTAELFEPLALMEGMDAELQYAPRTYVVHLRLAEPLARRQPSAPPPTLTLRNEVTGASKTITLDWLPERTPAMERLATHAQPVRSATQQAIAQLGHLHVYEDDSGALHIPSGDYVIRQDVLLPRGVSMVIDRGTTLTMAPGVSLLARGAITVAGTREAPVRVRPLDVEQPFGVLAALGNSKTVCEIRFLQITGGSEAHLLGAHYSGQLALHHHAKVTIDNSTVGEGHADDGANVKYAQVRISRSSFGNNFADQLDLDVVTGSVEDCRFGMPSSGSLNGDGLDVSFSELWVRRSQFRRLADKGMSIGENSTVLVENSSFASNDLAVAVKGGSRGILGANVFKANTTDIFAYKKQKIFDGGEVLFLDPAAHSSLKIFADSQSVVRDIDRPANFEFHRVAVDELLEQAKRRPPLAVGSREFDRAQDRRRQRAVRTTVEQGQR